MERVASQICTENFFSPHRSNNYDDIDRCFHVFDEGQLSVQGIGQEARTVGDRGLSPEFGGGEQWQRLHL